MNDSFHARAKLISGGEEYVFFRLRALEDRLPVGRLPFTHKILLENLLRCEDGSLVTREDVESLAAWDCRAEPNHEIAFRPSRVLLQDFTGVPAVVDLAAMREAMHRLGGDPERINPLQPVELVIDHSVQVDDFGSPSALDRNAALESERNHERYTFLRWGQKMLKGFKVVPPSMGIVHQVNLEHLARVVFTSPSGKEGTLAFPDTLVGTDSHTTMINGLGVLGWGVGGIEAEAAMLGQPLSMLIPHVVGFKLTGRLAEGATATDLVLTVTEMLRAYGVVGKFVEFYGSGLDHLPLADRATIANMAPEYGATCGIFPIDAETLRYLELSGRSAKQIALVEAYAREQTMFRECGSPEADYSGTLELDLGLVEPSLAGPRRPQDRIALSAAKSAFTKELQAALSELPPCAAGAGSHGDEAAAGLTPLSKTGPKHGSVVIAAITSCTNTSNPAVMIGAGLLAKKAVERGLKVPSWVKTSLAPGSRVVTKYLREAGLLPHLESLGFHVVGYGCTTCIGNSGPLPENVAREIRDGDLIVCSVLSGNRNFEGRVHPETRMNYLASPPLVVAYALAGRMDIDLYGDPIGFDNKGAPVYLREIWPSSQEIDAATSISMRSDMFKDSYRNVFEGDERWNSLEVPEGKLYGWEQISTYIRQPPYFRDMRPEPDPVEDIKGARVIAFLGDSVTTDHISPAGVINVDSPAGRYLVKRGIQPADFNTYGSRRGNHEVMMRGTFANVRLRNRLAPGTEGGWTTFLPTGEVVFIYDSAMSYAQKRIPLVVLAGKEYGTGSSRDWAAKGPRLLGIRAVIAESFERIHRTNLVGMGIVPLQFEEGQNAGSLGLTGREIFDIEGLEDLAARRVTVTARREPEKPGENGEPVRFVALVRIDTPREELYYRHGGILQYVLRDLLHQERPQ